MMNQGICINHYDLNNDLEYNSDLLNDNNKELLSKRKSSFNRGRWSTEEHLKFVKGFLEYGNEWKKVQSLIVTRSSTQARSHAQKFFLRIKKNINLLDNFCSPFSNSQGIYIIIYFQIYVESLNDSVSIKNFLELLTSEEKKKLDPSSVQLSENQKLKLLHLVAKLSNTFSYNSLGNKTYVNDKQLFNHHQIFKNQKKHRERFRSYCNQGDSEEEIDTMAATISQIAIRQIFEIKKDKGRRESINSIQKEYKSLKMSVNNHSNLKESFANQTLSSDLSSTNSMSSIREDSKFYNEMMVLFGKKRKNETKFKDISRHRFYSSNEPQYDLYSHKMLFSNTNFFPKDNISLSDHHEVKKQKDIEYSLKNNPFSLNFDTFSYQNMNKNDCSKSKEGEKIISNQEIESIKAEYDNYNLQNDFAYIEDI